MRLIEQRGGKCPSYWGFAAHPIGRRFPLCLIFCAGNFPQRPEIGEKMLEGEEYEGFYIDARFFVQVA
jgi:hypothetical protein